ncbi:eukaryotic translation initiation factor 3 subunit L-like [Symsagittifera roscoffensis]|uniref:eukaryotic translation initiation factor 3 subunit L-like n=1 Tax=Symsagittifera roscoffensis TaxID=84072 RepID=UPI00307BF4BB
MFNDDLDDAYPSTGSQKIDSGSSHKYSEKGGHRDRNDRNNRDRGERDREGGNVYQASTQIPEPVKNFLLVFQHALQEHNIYQIQNIYETGFDRMTEQYFKTRPWPAVDDVQDLVGNDQVFLMLYRELYYRHIYASVPQGPNLNQRFESYYNYCALFNMMLQPEDEPIRLELPNLWLWDIIDEFIYQFQQFAHFRSRLSNKSKEELAKLDKNQGVWNIHSVLNVMYSLIAKSRINEQLSAYNSGIAQERIDEIAGKFGGHPLYKFLGFFALVGLCRLQCLIGDYYLAVTVVDNIQLHKKGMTWSPVPSCQITMYYYVGFAYLMMRRYSDSIKCFTDILLYIQRTKNVFHVRSYQQDMIQKQTDQMYYLLQICLALHPQTIDESVTRSMNDKLGSGDRMQKLQRGGTGGQNAEEDFLGEMEQLFLFACPKFISPTLPNFNEKKDNHKDMLNLQARVFMDEVREQSKIAVIRSFLKLYSSISIQKLAGFMNLSEAELRTHLMTFKHKMKNLVWSGGASSLDGQFKIASDIDFYVDGDMIHIADTKVAAKYGEYFIAQIQKCDELKKRIKAINVHH